MHGNTVVTAVTSATGENGSKMANFSHSAGTARAQCTMRPQRVIQVKAFQGSSHAIASTLLGSDAKAPLVQGTARRAGAVVVDLSLTTSWLLVSCLVSHPGGVFAQRAHSANYYGDYPGKNPENHPPAESCTINSKLKNSNI